MRLSWLLLLAACSRGADVTPAVPAVTSWAIQRMDDRWMIPAGTGSGLSVGSPVTLVAVDPDGTSRVVGSAQVAETGPVLSRIEPQRLDPAAGAVEGLQARTPAATDQVALDRLPLAVPPGEAVSDEGGGEPPVSAAASSAAPTAGTGSARATPTAGTGGTSTGSATPSVAVPAALQSGTVDDRIDALGRYEKDASATAAIVWVMKNDPSPEVRRKAWRVVRARWNRGTGQASEHEEAASWAAANGASDTRKEAVDALGKHTVQLSRVSRYLDDASGDMRIQAAQATAEVGVRVGKRGEARTLLQARLAKETDPDVSRKISSILAHDL